MGYKLGLTRASYIVSVSCFGSFAFAFDTGVISMSSVTTKYLQHGQTVLFLIG
jgi:hypothetical protein